MKVTALLRKAITPIRPTVVSRYDKPGSYSETLTMSATPNVSSGRPTGTESIANIESLSRSYTNAAGQTTHTDSYFNLSGLTYSTSTTLGTENTHFYRTTYGYDSFGRQSRVLAPTGTVTRTVFDTSSGDASSSEADVNTVNALGEVLTVTDRNGNVHTLTRDVLGRIISDAVTTLGSGVDGSVRRIETEYDKQGNAYLFTSYDAVSGGNIVNQIQREFNGLGQMTKEYQAVAGAVNTSTTPNVQYAYSEMSGGGNHSRLTSITYPNGKVLTFNYSSGLNDSISRLSSLSDSSGTLEGYDYLGESTVVRRTHSQPGVDLTYINQSGENDGDAGDQYTGLDRFGRIVDQRWLKTSNISDLDRFFMGYDRDSNRLFRDNALNNSYDELYHANGSSAGYDNLNQQSDFRRGALSDTNSDNIPDTVTTAASSQA